MKLEYILVGVLAMAVFGMLGAFFIQMGKGAADGANNAGVVAGEVSNTKNEFSLWKSGN